MGSDPVSQLDRVVSTQILGAIILGKFVGDGLLIYFDHTFGRPDSLIIGAAVGLAFMLLWPSIERTYKKWQQNLWGSSEEDQNGKN
jgi:hypothetical protein